jgi:hypothetical protein
MKKTLAAALCAMAAPLPALASEPAVTSPPLITIRGSDVDAKAASPLTSDPHMKVEAAGSPTYANERRFVTADRRFAIDVSRYDQVTLILKDWPVDEFMYMVQGQLEITDSNGVKNLYGPGDAFVMPKGFNGTWRQLSPIKKITATYYNQKD